MKLTNKDIEQLRIALSAAKVIGAELAVLANGKIMGVNDKRDAAIISDLELSIPGDVKIGLGRLQELDKRLALFGESVEAELKQNDRGDVSLITLQSGRSKVQFRCTSMSLLERKYPQENADVPFASISLTKNEIIQLSRAARTLSAESIVVKISSSGGVHIECVDSNNDQFALNAELEADFNGEAETVVFTYNADRLASLLDAGGKDYDIMAMFVGESGSITAVVKGHALIIMPQSTGE